MDQSIIRFDRTQEHILKDIQLLSNSFDITDNNKNLITKAFTIMQSSNKLLYNYVGIVCKKIWNYLNENKRDKIMHDENYINLSPSLVNLSIEEFKNWDKVLLLTDEINGFINLNINFDNNVTYEFINDFLNYLDTLSMSNDILLFYYVYTTRNVTFTTIDDLKNLLNSAKHEFEDDICVKCTSLFSLNHKFNIINYYYEIFILNSNTDIILHDIWGTEEEYNNKQKETKQKSDNFDIFGKLFNNNSLGKTDLDDMEENDMGNLLKNAMMSMLGGFGDLGGINKKEDSDDDIDDDVDDDVNDDPDVQSIEKLISKISDKGHFSGNDKNNLD
jgi:hypothetical protein